ncbi:DnaD domain protein [Lentilactobacillus senioris]|uniref:DnaD domain-containing protein n=1 Tax=Lentilactobacillus senioris TaxID=931534 RepID=UPI00227ECF40|nr:DnaD domain protein [Lentilactobacillus senioris]MCY9806846.1 DnaD domain protein [Lentilactobacillus senioris]
MDQLAQQLINAGTTNISNVVLQNFRQLGMTTDELVLYLLIKQNDSTKVLMPNAKQVANQMGLTEKQIFSLFHQLIEKKLMMIISETVDGKQVDGYDFAPLYVKLNALITTQETKSEPATTVKSSSNSSAVKLNRQMLFGSLEKEFGRTLSPIEMETVSQWLDLDHYSPEIINLALKEAVLNQVYNLKYMDRILMNWEKKNLKTAAQVENAKNQNSHSSKENDLNNYNGPDIPLINLTDQ